MVFTFVRTRGNSRAKLGGVGWPFEDRVGSSAVVLRKVVHFDSNGTPPSCHSSQRALQATKPKKKVPSITAINIEFFHSTTKQKR